MDSNSDNRYLLCGVFKNSIEALAKTIAQRDSYTANHQRRVAKLAVAIAQEMNLSSERITGISLAAAIHDIGKMSVPIYILTKPDKLTADEFNIIKEHPQAGFDILKKLDFPWPIERIVLQHHEKIDGSGYPQGLIGDQILLEAKIITVADIVEAMSSHRPYRPALGIDRALAEIKDKQGRLYDSEVVATCLELFAAGDFSWELGD